MTVKEYLSQVQDFEEAIHDQKKYIETIRELLTSIGGMGMSPDKVQSSGADKDKFANVIAKVIDAEEKLQRMEEKLCFAKIHIAEQIHRMDNLLFKKLLMLRYLEWKQYGTIRKVADELGYSVDHTKRLHRDALCAFGEILRQLNP